MEFTHDGESYTFDSREGYWIIYAPDDTLLTICVGENTPLPTEDILKLMVKCYRRGNSAGLAEGYSNAQSDMRRVLGIKA